jgi:BMFP domain-containing protein YqiC
VAQRRARRRPARRPRRASGARPRSVRSGGGERSKKKLEKTLAELEERIAKLEAKQKERNDRLCDPAGFADERERFSLLTEMQVGATKLEELTARWESTAEALESAKDGA